MESLLELARQPGQLTREQCALAVGWLADESAPAGPKEIFLELLRSRGETAGEIAGFALALLERAKDPQVPMGDLAGPALDVCGTGGDRLELFNISTTAMFVLAAGGAVVVKHGNRAITSQCGGADVLEELGVRIECDAARLREGLQRAGAGFLFAPAYHPAFKAIAPVRKALAARGIPTIFNLLGPLLNPARPPFQLVGVYSADLLPKYAEALRLLGRERAWAVHGEGADELTCAGPSEVFQVDTAHVSHNRILPADIGLETAPLAALRGGDKAENARILVDILSGTESGARTDAVLLNAAAGFVVAGLEQELGAALERARRAIYDGEAARRLRMLVEITR
jgi:anthranilate phosphoribosyltransferase